jgi:uncharacterized protein
MCDLRIKAAKGPTILLQSGVYFDLLDPAGSAFTVADIAHGLAHCCRFAGQCNLFYSVAEHCWHASYIVPAPYRRAALLHDAAEAFIGDVTRPLKSLLPDYKAIEKGVEAAIGARFRVEIDHPEVKAADVRMLAAEQAANMPHHDDQWPILAGIKVPEINFRFWSPADAKAAWLARYEQLAA